MEQVIDPALADLQVEYRDAVQQGYVWRRRWVPVAGYVVFLKVIAVYGNQLAMRTLHGWTVDGDGRLSRRIGFCAAGVVVATSLLVMPSLLVSSWTAARAVKSVIYLIPQALPIAVPVGFTIGLICSLGRRVVASGSTGAVLLIASVCSIASFATLGWIAPAANQSFRVSVAGRSVIRGANELTIRELGQLLTPGTHEPMLLAPPTDVRHLSVIYHARWALSCAPFAFALFALSVVALRSAWRLTLGLGMCGAYLAYFLAGPSLYDILPAVAVGWLPNVVIAVISVAVTVGPLRSIESSPVARESAEGGIRTHTHV
jgi:hypothetical protein